MNDIRSPEEKNGGRLRFEASCRVFREFIDRMNMEEMEFTGNMWTWANNWHDEGYIEARLDRFFGAFQWLRENSNAVVEHVVKQSSDHSMLVLDTNPTLGRKKKRFYFDKRWLGKSEIEEVIRTAWNSDFVRSAMFRVSQKIKRCK